LIHRFKKITHGGIGRQGGKPLAFNLHHRSKHKGKPDQVPEINGGKFKEGEGLEFVDELEHIGKTHKLRFWYKPAYSEFSAMQLFRF